jgi:ABC-type phosphate/phosphonate transport system substrate-binding protein
MLNIRFAIAAQRRLAEPAFRELAAAVAHVSHVELSPLFVDDYVALREAMRRDPACTAWTPPLLARDLVRARLAAPLVAVGRRGSTGYYAAIVASRRSGITRIDEIAGKRVGWVSELSAAGYVIPRLFLRSLGMDPRTIFVHESFLGTHEGALLALLDGNVDVIATCATSRGTKGAFDLDPRLATETLLAGVGPIPGDLVMTGTALDDRARDALRGALLSIRVQLGGALTRLMNVDRFEVVTHRHFDPLNRLAERAANAVSEPSVTSGE